MCSTSHVLLCSLKEKLKALAELLHQALFTPDQETPGGRMGGEGEGGGLGRVTNLQQLIMATMIRWAQQPINSPELIQQIFALLYRQCDEINEVVRVCLFLPSQDLDSCRGGSTYVYIQFNPRVRIMKLHCHVYTLLVYFV